MKPLMLNVRVTGILVEDNKILLVNQNVSSSRKWSLPGGRLDEGETIEESLVREMKEETGLKVECVKMLYLCEKFDSDPSILHITFLLNKISGELTLPTNEFDENNIHDVKFFNFDELTELGFTEKFVELTKKGFPNSGSYMGSKVNIGL